MHQEDLDEIKSDVERAFKAALFSTDYCILRIIIDTSKKSNHIIFNDFHGTSMKYKLVVNEKQAKIISWALDFYSRTMGGQLEDILCRFHWRNLSDDKRDEAHDILADLKCMLTGLNRNQPNMGLYNISEDGRVAYDLHQVIRHQIAHNNPNDYYKYSVDFDTPRQVSSEPLAKIEHIKE